jgi:hypothetical protein
VANYLTNVLYLLEKNAALRSFFTDYDKEHGRHVREIWLSIFRRQTLNG